MTQIIVQGTFDLSNNQLVLNFNNAPQLLNNQNHSVLLSQQSNNQESFVPSAQQASSRQLPIIRKLSPHFYTSTLGLAGGVGLLVSCIWSVLLPAIGSVGVMTFAYLVNRRIVPLQIKELASEAVKTQSVFAQHSPSLLDELNPNIATLPPPISPVSNATNQTNVMPPPPPPMPGLGSLLDEPTDTGNLPLPMSPMSNVINQANIPPPPPPSAPLMSLTIPLPPVQKKESQKTSSMHTDLKKPGPSGDPRDALLFSIRNSFNFMQTKELIRGDPEKYSSNLLLKELKSTYERALAISESDRFKDWKKYFKDKIDGFEKNFDIAEQEENQTTEYSDMEDICEKASRLDSLLKNMQWVKSLLQVLSERKGLSDKVRSHCSEKSKSIDKHIEKLQRRNEKKSEEVKRKEANTEESSSQIAKNPGEILLKAFNEEKTPEQKLQEIYDAVHGNSSSESESSDEGDWD
ncbi:hypothetical protein [Candidatus Rhabdochlamydia sp. T3358]|uniref:hypothetical protein n=1 Tax=Candidatus Rhabdochlamydia sp. T3358 TaxID=2099795 RepID=UPI0010B2B87F|nr:hypothetical protein [Candidatus Rhabdochlamydia sp. T3358]VHO03631.1 hypothetical protein RHT_00988 [Candidatus Rhabdochlamydia sp. T3358]